MLRRQGPIEAPNRVRLTDPPSGGLASSVRRPLRIQFEPPADPCACRKLYPTVLMMKSAEDWPHGELAEPLDRPMARRILVQGQMCSEFVLVAGVGRKNPAQMGFAEDDDVIEAFSADRADQPLRMPILPR